MRAAPGIDTPRPARGKKRCYRVAARSAAWALAGAASSVSALAARPAEIRHQGYFALYGIESPGLTASLAIGDYAAGLALGSL